MDNFNPALPTTMHVDINSCFATIEQQANPLLRGKPVVVAAYVKEYGCILAASTEAKRRGVKTGMRVSEGRRMIPGLVVLPPDPPKYRVVNRQMLAILQSYTAHVSVESIDEMVMGLDGAPALTRGSMGDIAREIKLRIRREIGEWMTVSCGIAPNRYLAKVASGLQKPDGLVHITRENIRETFAGMQLEDFCGIKSGNAGRLRAAGIMTPLQFLDASADTLVRAFRAVTGRHWWLRLHGYEDGVMYMPFDRSGKDVQKSFGQSYVLGTPHLPSDPRLWQVLTQLVMKMARRVRRDGYLARGISLSVMFADHSHWHTQEKQDVPLFSDGDFSVRLRRLLARAPYRPVKLLAISSYALETDAGLQQSLFPEENKKRDVTRAVDTIQDRFGDFIIHPGRMMDMEQRVLDRIAFGGVDGLSEIPFEEQVRYESQY